jgi:DNA replication protein DnaC
VKSQIEVKETLKALKLMGMYETFESRSYENTEAKQNFLETFSLLLQDESDQRDSKKQQRRLKGSQLSEQKNLTGFDWAFNPKIPKAIIMELLNLKFIKTGDDALFIGSPGTGKSHIAKAIVTKACCVSDYKVLYKEAHKLFEELFEARQLGKRKRAYNQIVGVDLLVIDDLFLRKRIPPESADDLQEIIMDRYSARKSTLITSNRIIEDWGKCLGDNAVASAILDRLLHNGQLLKFEGKSYRLKEAANRLVKRKKES